MINETDPTIEPKLINSFYTNVFAFTVTKVFSIRIYVDIEAISGKMNQKAKQFTTQKALSLNFFQRSIDFRSYFSFTG
jgi:hypothetical protein